MLIFYIKLKTYVRMRGIQTINIILISLRKYYKDFIQRPFSDLRVKRIHIFYVAI